MTLKSTIVLLTILVSFTGMSQVSMEGSPLSYSHIEIINDEDIMTINLPVPNISSLLLADIAMSRGDAVWRDAVAVPVNVGISDVGTGTWYELPGLGKVWKLKLKALGAHSMEVNFDQFSMPEGTRLYIYNEAHTEHIGAYTSQNNKISSKLSTHMIQGDHCIIEYFEPNGSADSGELHIADVTYRYRDFLHLNSGGGSQVCEVDVNCFDGSVIDKVERSVVRIRLRSGNDFFWSTGVLVNNTALNCKPFILTSYRTSRNPYTLEFATQDDFQYTRFYFDYKRGECGEGTGQDHSISGANIRANSNDGGGEEGSDFMLLELSSEVPIGYNPHWAGWNALGNPGASQGVCIHHPLGDVKKVSTFSITPSSADFGVSDTHWKVYWSENDIGFGVTEIGSIGAPLFSNEGLVFGTLTAGGSSCNEDVPGGVNNPDFFGKMSKHWVDNPNPIPQKLRSWLDPTGSGFSVFEGSDNPCLVGVESISDFSLDKLVIWPNPAQNIVHCNLGEKTSGVLTVSDITGKNVFSRRFNSLESVDIDLKNFVNGLYVISINSVKASPIQSKFLVEK